MKSVLSLLAAEFKVNALNADKNSSRQHSEIFFLFSLKIGIEFHADLETICI